MNKKTIALAGNPNVGKSTVFNALTGMRQHTGNWSGKTVDPASGQMRHKDTLFHFVDLPGAYSLRSGSPDEKAAADYIASGEADIILMVADATCLQRNLLLVGDILSVTRNAVLCVNLMDEARKKGIEVNTDKLETYLHVPVVPLTARSGQGLDQLLRVLYDFPQHSRDADTESPAGTSFPDMDHVYRQCVSLKQEQPHRLDRTIDRIVTSKALGFPIMLLLLLLIFWLTMSGANYPSAALSDMFALLEEKLRFLMKSAMLPDPLTGLLMDGLYTTVTWVVSVMLPPMAIFFPLFTLLEDLGYLPRIAFNLDGAFRRCGAHGKQSLTMCMGLGCNACGVTGCRIIESPRERMIAILTNNFVPCNGRFPTLIAIILIFFSAGAAGSSSLAAGIMLTGTVLLGIIVTLLISRLLSGTLLKGLPSSFVLELPPYRKPKIGSVIVRSVLDRTIFVLGRAVLVAAPAGVIIWLLANIAIGEASILTYCTNALDPLGRLIGVDGVILTAFILGFPANEIVIPVMLMCYMSTGMLTDYASLTQLQGILTSCGWTPVTALCVLLLCLFHFPCGTTCLTIKKETGSLKWTALAFALPTIIGVSLCFLINTVWQGAQLLF